MFFIRFYRLIQCALLVVVASAHADIPKPCPLRTFAYPWESGNCLGDNPLGIPLDTVGLNLVWYGAAPDGDYGFGNNGWRLSVDWRLTYSASRIVVYAATGAVIVFVPGLVAGTWISADRRISTDRIQQQGKVFRVSPHSGGDGYVFTDNGSGFALTSIFDNNENQTVINRDTQNHIISMRNPYHQEMSLSYSNGKATSILDFSGASYTFQYDANDSLARVEYPDRTAYQLAYHDFKNKKRVTKLTERDGKNNQFSYYASGEIFAILNPYGWKTQYTYTADSVTIIGDGITTETYQNGALIRAASSSGTVNIVRDALLNPIRITDSFGLVTETQWSPTGFLISKRDSNGVVIKYSYDSKGNLIRKVTNSMVEAFAYNAQNLLVAQSGPGIISRKQILRDAKGNPKRIAVGTNIIFQGVYNSRGQLTKYANESGLYYTLTYDGYGNVITRSDSLGRTTNTTYNGINLPTSISAGQLKFSAEYDQLGRPTKSSLSGPTGSVSRESSYTTTQTAQLSPFKRLRIRIAKIAPSFAGFVWSGPIEPAESIHTNITVTSQGAPTQSQTIIQGPNGQYSENGDLIKPACKTCERGPDSEIPQPVEEPPKPCMQGSSHFLVKNSEGTYNLSSNTEVSCLCEPRNYQSRLVSGKFYAPPYSDSTNWIKGGINNRYRLYSGVCDAAVHAGFLGANESGMVKVKLVQASPADGDPKYKDYLVWPAVAQNELQSWTAAAQWDAKYPLNPNLFTRRPPNLWDFRWAFEVRPK